LLGVLPLMHAASGLRRLFFFFFLEAAYWQHADLCKSISGEPVTLHTILQGVGGTCYTDQYAHEHTLNQFLNLGLGHQCAIKLARKLHAHSVLYANKLVTTRHAIELKYSQPASGAGCFQQPSRSPLVLSVL